MPLSYLIALFIGLPVIELALLFRLHEVIGLGPTILIVILTGTVGAALVKRQGIAILLNIQTEMSNGNLPAPQLMDGVMILLAGAFLITPGVLTDLTGFLLLIPYVRKKIRFWLRKKLEEKIQSNYVNVYYHQP
ncbi:MAG: FxsA family protein [Kiritimatiellales bacterium]|nr:FxsA family protein [Kiritimatiellales bacterium]